jgi:hypothetical protein
MARFTVAAARFALAHNESLNHLKLMQKKSDVNPQSLSRKKDRRTHALTKEGKLAVSLRLPVGLIQNRYSKPCVIFSRLTKI